MERFGLERNPAICTPVTGRTLEEILEQVSVVRVHLPDVIEWRADFFEELGDAERVLAVLAAIKAATDIPVLFTIRAHHEGGERIALSTGDKVDLLEKVCRQSDVELVDFETSNGDVFVEKVRAAAHMNEKQLILSYHNFDYSPGNNELLKKAKIAENMGADFVKLAVMPEAKADVFELLEATRIMDEALDVPVITMSMGELGGLSRVMGWAYGSVLTFAVGVEMSAPGQMPIKELRQTIYQMQELLPSWRQ